MVASRRPLFALRVRSALLLCGALGGAHSIAATLGAQSLPTPSATPVPVDRRQMVGFVRDVSGGPLEGVTVQIHGARITTDKKGAFQVLTRVTDTASISLRRVGFEPLDAFISTRNGQWDTVIVQMDAATTKLSEVKVTEDFTSRAGGIRGFSERQDRGIGSFVLRQEIVDRGSQRLTDILRSKKGVMIVSGRLRFAASYGSRGGNCQPNVFLDGARAPGMEVDEIAAQTVEAIELYPNLSTIPLEFQTIGRNTTPCGTVVIWTRIPNSKGR